MNVLITGGAGFIGSHLADELLARGDEVWAIDDLTTGSLENVAHLRTHSKFHLVVDTVLNESRMDELVQRADHIYHLAAVVGVKLVVESPVRTLETNLRSSEIVFKLAHQYKKRLFLASTSEVYGRHRENKPLTETAERIYGPTTVGRWSYAGAKAIDEFMALAYHRERGLDVVIGRFFNTVGPRQTGQYGMVIPRFVKAALDGRPITVYGTGEQSRSFTYVGDAVWAITRLMQSASTTGEIYNIGNGEEITINALARKVKEMTESRSEIQYQTYVEAYGQDFEDMEFRTPDIGKIAAAIGYRPTVDLQGILERVIRYFEERQGRVAVTEPSAESLAEPRAAVAARL